MHFFIGFHAALGELGLLAFLWVLVEFLNPNERSVKRAQAAAFAGILFLVLSWVVGGYYYVGSYGANVKPAIKAGPTPWSHDIIMEVKEHAFILLPFIALLVWGLVRKYGRSAIEDRSTRNAIILLCGFIVIFGFLVAGMGYLISSGFRAALETKIGM